MEKATNLPKSEDLYSLSFDECQCYKVVEECIRIIKKTRPNQCLKLLDVGGYPGLIHLFLPDEDITILNVQSSNFNEAGATSYGLSTRETILAEGLNKLPDGSLKRYIDECARLNQETFYFSRNGRRLD